MTTTAHTIRTAALLLAATLAVAAPRAAQAVGGNYTIVGGTAAQKTEVHRALKASAFNWSTVPTRVEIRIVAGAQTQAVPGLIQIDANLLDSGMFAWGIVQHEYAHQVDWYLLRSDARTALTKVLGGVTWGIGITDGYGVEHDDLTGERFANQLTWAYWPTADNAIEPATSTFTPKRFRTYVAGLIKAEQAKAAAAAAAAAAATATTTATATTAAAPAQAAAATPTAAAATAAATTTEVTR